MEDYKPPKPTEMAGAWLNIAVIGVMSVGVYWKLFMMKYGTVGTRMYGFYGICCVFIMAVLCAGSVSQDDQIMFQIAVPILWVNLIIHYQFTNQARKKNHVHTYALGVYRMPPTLGLIMGIAIGMAFISVECLVYGAFHCASVFCCYITDEMFVQRDKHRGYIMQDAIQYQQRMEEIFNGQRA